ncbi:MAG TPA: hypothetical protein VHA77_06190, partial [Xanthobacteraceae bacterium]|nr:hypothetical protein [Xanthobacteraceae bacterium]
MKFGLALAFAAIAFPAGATTASGDGCPASGDMVLVARTPQVDLYDAAGGKRVQTMDAAKFPACAPITGRAPNMMLQIDMSGAKYWVPPYMVKYRFSGKLPAVCRNLAMGSNTEKVGATRGLGEGCPKP